MKNVLVKTILILVATLAINQLTSAQDVTIPDANFKAALLAHDPIIDTNDDGEIQVTEAEAFDGYLYLFNQEIADDTGLEAFINITKLDISNNSLTNLDISSNSDLTYLYAYNNTLGTIDLSNNLQLDTLLLFSTGLTSIDVSNNTALKYLHLAVNQLTSLDVTNNTALENIIFSTNDISSFNFPAGLTTTLKGLTYGDNPISSTFDFTQFPNLEVLSCTSSDLTSLDVSGLSSLKALVMFDNPITSIDLSLNTSLELIYGSNTHIPDWDLSNNPNLTLVHFLANGVFETEDRVETINLANGNNGTIESLYIGNNPSLTCIQVDDPVDPFPNLENSILNGFNNFSSICVAGAINFADEAFEAALLSHDPVIDINGDEVITESEASTVTGTLNLRQQNIKNVQEIEHFTNITGLDLYANEVGNLDLSANSQLTNLDISYNSTLAVLSLDNGNNEALTTITTAGSYGLLNCVTVDDPVFADANWSSFAASVGASFSTDCTLNLNSNFENELISDGYDLNDDGAIQVSEAEVITELYYSSKLIYGFWGMEAFTALEVLELPGTINSTTAVNFTQCSKLTRLEFPSSQTPSIDLTCSPLLTWLDLNGSERTNFTTLDLSKNTALTHLYIQNSHFETLDISNSSNLIYVNVQDNDLTELDLSQASQLYVLNAMNNDLNTLNIKNGNIEGIHVPSFNVSNNPDLSCITVDDVAYAEANFTNIDEGVFFDPDCSNPPIQFADANLEAALLSYEPAIDLDEDGDIRVSEAAAFTGVLNLSGFSISAAEELHYFTGVTGLDISNNNLTSLNIKNGNNSNFTVFNATNNSSLTCIKVDVAPYSTTNWTNIDEGVSFSPFCDLDEVIYIPNETFKTVLISFHGVGTNGDGDITYADALAFTGSFNLSYSAIDDLTGLEAFTNATGVSFSFSGVSELDVSNLTELTTLSVSAENLDDVDVRYNTKLETLSLSNMTFDGINLSNHTQLVSLTLNNCGLTSIDLSQNTLLESLRLSNNELTSIDLSNNLSLTDLTLQGNELSSLDISMLTALTDIYIDGDLPSMDLSNQPNLVNIEIPDPQFTSIDLSNNLLLEDVRIFASEGDEEDFVRSELEEIIFGENTLIEYMEINGNKLQSLDLSFMIFPGRYVYAADNFLEELNIGLVESLDISGNPNLTCAKTTNVTYAEDNYDYDEGLNFDPNCFSTENDILTFSIPDEVESAVIDTEEHTIGVLMPVGTNSTSLVPTFTISDDATVSPESGISQDFTSNVIYTVTAEDGTDQDWEVELEEVAADPTDIILSSTTINENLAPGSLVGTFTTEDENFSDTHTYTFIADDDNESFDISGNQLLLVVSADFETKNEYNVRVQTEDANGGLFDKNFTITVNDTNDAPTDVQLSNQTIDESNPIGTVIGILSTSDVDEGDTHTYSVELGCDVCDIAETFPFVIVGDELRSNIVFDYENQDRYLVTIASTDAGGLTDEQVFWIDINDIPAQVTSVDLSSQSINENENAGTVVGSLTTTGEDLSGSYTYTLVSGDGDADNGSFTISNDQLLTDASFDFETKSSYSIRIMTDDGTLTREEMFTITVADVSETPTDITLSAASIVENNSIDDLIGTLTTTDEDNGESHIYSLVSGEGDTDNASFSIDGNELLAGEIFDFESQDSYDIRIQTDDGNGGTFEKAFIISIDNINESITVVSPIDDQTVVEGFGTLAIDLSEVFEDADGDDLSFSASSSNAAIVTVSNSGSTLTITEVGVGSATITVSADDGSGVTTSDEFDVTVDQALGLDTEISLEVYPNPTADFININADKQLNINLINLRGQVIQSISGRAVRLDVQDLSAGTYLLKCSDGASSTTRRIIKAN